MDTEMTAIRNEVRNCARMLQKNFFIIFLFGVIGFLAGSIVDLIPTPTMYTAGSSITKTTVTTQYGPTIEAYADVLKTTRVYEEIRSQMGTDAPSNAELSGMLSASTSSSKSVLYITATHTDPLFAIKVSNLAAEILVGKINEMFKNPDVAVLDTATSAWVSSNKRMTSVLYRAGGALAMVFLCCGYYLMRVLASKKLLSIEDCTLDGSLATFGVIPFVKNAARPVK